MDVRSQGAFIIERRRSRQRAGIEY